MAIKVGNFFTNLAQVGGAALEGNRAEKDKAATKAINDRLLAMQQQAADRSDKSLALETQNAADAKANREADNKRADLDLALRTQGQKDNEGQTKHQNDVADAERLRSSTAAAGLCSELQTLDPRIKPEHCKNASEEDLRMQVDRIIGDNDRLRDVQIAHSMQRDDMIKELKNQQIMASSSLATVNRMVMQVNATNMKARTLAAEGKSGTLEYHTLFDVRDPATGQTRNLLDEQLKGGFQVISLGQQGQNMGGVASSSPATDAAVQKMIPFAALSPQQQAAVSLDYATRLKTGQPIDQTEALTRGIPLSQIATTVGMHIDPVSGQPQAGAAAMPDAAPADATSSVLSQMFTAGRPTSGPVLGGAFQAHSQQPSSPTPSIPMQGPGATLQPTPAAPIFPAPVAPAPSVAPNANIFARSGQPGDAMGISPARPATVAPQNSPQPQFAALTNAPTMPDAEKQARLLLDQGQDYDSVIQSTPLRFRQLLQAKLPRRIPTLNSPTSIAPPLAAPKPLGGGDEPPMFSPPGQ